MNNNAAGQIGGEGAGAAASAPQTPFCAQLRSKKYFMLDVLPTDESQYLDDSNYCWCFRTQQVVGPDGSQAAPDQCKPGRACYQSALA